MIFLSYSWADAFCVHQYAKKLIYNNRKIWIDILNLDLSKEIKEQIENAIIKSSHLQIIDSSNSRHSPWVKFEIDIAQKTNTPILCTNYKKISELLIFQKI